MKYNFIKISVFVLFLASCGAKMAGESSVIDLPSVIPAAGLTLSATSLRVGSLLTITSTSTNLTNPTSVTINGTPALVLNSSANQMQVYVMPGSTAGYVGVITSGGIDYSISQVTVEATPAGASYTQQGAKLVGTGTSGTLTAMGSALKISADGSTAAVGGALDNGYDGGVWIYSRTGSSWTQQASKILGTGVIPGAAGGATQGYAVGISADGNTLMSGGAYDDDIKGAVWFFTRSGTSWTQQGPKITPADVSGTTAAFGAAGELSADGNTAIIGGFYDNAQGGAAWIYTRSGTSWTQQAKLIASNPVGTAAQGISVAISADGNTALVGGAADDSGLGAAWVFTRSGTNWIQQSKLIPTGNTGTANFGIGVALSANGNTAAVGGAGDNSGVGATWIYTRSGSSWTQQGTKLLGSSQVGPAAAGTSVSLSADGNTLMSGGASDDSGVGASWIYTRSGTTWTQQGSKIVGSGSGVNSYFGSVAAMNAEGSVMMCGGPYDSSFLGAVWVFGK
jgi:hypothetical protein